MEHHIVIEVNRDEIAALKIGQVPGAVHQSRKHIKREPGRMIQPYHFAHAFLDQAAVLLMNVDGVRGH